MSRKGQQEAPALIDRFVTLDTLSQVFRDLGVTTHETTHGMMLAAEITNLLVEKGVITPEERERILAGAVVETVSIRPIMEQTQVNQHSDALGNSLRVSSHYGLQMMTATVLTMYRVLVEAGLMQPIPPAENLRLMALTDHLIDGPEPPPV